ncbi:acetylglucosamine-6-sulfatase [Paraoerskovia sediminicola]|uniref:Acetylglucosamine-6-sulfatase n=1 Tax=Paraoerskovia sediminicola TaxID=1138587 RepID=A0ABM8G249_9CELL|nr:sulfatase-like hydrolase/transferase [Paraoerskovia sediminicola]BDZ42189.1 acetylglucosamine-6-sulfatase [Paraoerskovia sediminicola]
MTDGGRAARRPNVIVFFTDQQRADTLGVTGNPSGLTPNLDRMAGRGTMFEAACASNPVCAPSRAAVLTGRYPTEAGVHNNLMPLDPSIPTLGQIYQEAGYRTGYIGKWHLGSTNPVPREERQGYDHWLASNLLEFTSDAYRTVVYDDDGTPVELPGYRADGITDAAIRFIAESSDEPFFLFVSLLEPHHQNETDNYPAPEVYEKAFKDAWVPPDLAALGGTAPQHLPGYYGQVKRLDECMGRLRDVLVSLEIDGDTIVTYTSDHGAHFKTRNDEYKRSCHDASIRVPLLMEGPGIAAGRRVESPVCTVDLAPTLLEASGLARPEGMRDRSLLRDHGLDEDVFIQVSEAETGRALRTRRWKYHVVADLEGDPATTDAYRELELFDVSIDPYELDNLIDSEGHRDVAEQLRARLCSRVLEIEGIEPSIIKFGGQGRPLRSVEPTVRLSGLRGERFGHQGPRRTEVVR